MAHANKTMEANITQNDQNVHLINSFEKLTSENTESTFSNEFQLNHLTQLNLKKETTYKSYNYAYLWEKNLNSKKILT